MVDSLETSEKVRILIGINTDRTVSDSIKCADYPLQAEINYSHTEVKEEYQKSVIDELEESEDSKNVDIISAIYSKRHGSAVEPDAQDRTSFEGEIGQYK